MGQYRTKDRRRAREVRDMILSGIKVSPRDPLVIRPYLGVRRLRSAWAKSLIHKGRQVRIITIMLNRPSFVDQDRGTGLGSGRAMACDRRPGWSGIKVTSCQQEKVNGIRRIHKGTVGRAAGKGVLRPPALPPCTRWRNRPGLHYTRGSQQKYHRVRKGG